MSNIGNPIMTAKKKVVSKKPSEITKEKAAAAGVSVDNHRQRTPHKEITKERIAATQLMARLQEFALGGDVTLTKDQIRAAQILLDKVIPNQTVSKTELSGTVGVQYIAVTERFSDPEASQE